MSHSLPVVPDTTFTEREGIGHVGLAASRMQMIWREVPNTDLGIDGYLEVIVNGAPIGLIATQVKSGSSYIESPDETSFVFRAKSRHVRYWLSYRLPVIVVIYDPMASVAYWHYIQDYFSKHDDVPRTDTVPIRISKAALFDQDSRDQLVEIASTPDSTARAMLSLRASRYRFTQELLTQIEMTELYGKRKWLGDWLPLDTEREQLLIHSTLAPRGPAWYWFRDGTYRHFVPYLRSGLKHPNSRIQDESALALAAAVGREAVDDLGELLTSGYNVFGVTEALASVADLTPDDRRQLLATCWQQYNERSTIWTGDTGFGFLSLMARIGGHAARESFINRYLDPLPHGYETQTGMVRPRLLRNAGYLWDVEDLPELRQFVVRREPGLEDLAIAAIAKMGETQDCDLILDYVGGSAPHAGTDDIRWLSKRAAPLFSAGHLTLLVDLIQGPYNLQVLAHCVLPDLCCRLDEPALLQLLKHPVSAVRSYAARGLVAIGRAEVVLEKETELLDDSDYADRIGNVAALTSAGDWTVIDRLLSSDEPSIRQGVAEGLRSVRDEKAVDRLFALLQSKGPYDTQVHLSAADSLSIIGDEEALVKVLGWLLDHPYEQSTDLLASVLVYLDRKLYCPVEWSRKRERDFSILRYSVQRDDYR